MAQRPLLRRSQLGTVWLITRWHHEGDTLVADTKVDVTDEYEALRRAEAER